MTLLLALVLPTLILVAWSLERRERASERTELLGGHERERKQWMDERTLLLNRIKPETAQPILHDGPVVTPEPVALDADDPWMQMSAEDLADAAMAQELAR